MFKVSQITTHKQAINKEFAQKPEVSPTVTLLTRLFLQVNCQVHSLASQLGTLGSREADTSHVFTLQANSAGFHLRLAVIPQVAFVPPLSSALYLQLLVSDAEFGSQACESEWLWLGEVVRN
jgi:hypothetical protein